MRSIIPRKFSRVQVAAIAIVSLWIGVSYHSALTAGASLVMPYLGWVMVIFAIVNLSYLSIIYLRERRMLKKLDED